MSQQPGVDEVIQKFETTLAVVFFAPFYLFTGVWYREWRDSPVRRARKQMLKNLTPPKPEKRRRALTLPLEKPKSVHVDSKKAAKRGSQKSKIDRNTTNEEERQKHIDEHGEFRGPTKKQITTSQSGSRLMSGLPAEIREMIWQQVVLSGADHNGAIKLQWKQFDPDGKPEVGRGIDNSELGVMGLLQSCREVYTEVIDLLYSTPTFLFADAELFLGFTAIVLSRRLQKIKNLQLRFTSVTGPERMGLEARSLMAPLSYENIQNLHARNQLPHPKMEDYPSTFSIVCDVVGGMRGLKNLNVSVERPAFDLESQEKTEKFVEKELGRVGTVRREAQGHYVVTLSEGR